jgi:threonine/homoserine efflux transporter RhtA
VRARHQGDGVAVSRTGTARAPFVAANALVRLLLTGQPGRCGFAKLALDVVIAAGVGAVVLEQALDTLDWLAIALIVTANVPILLTQQHR